MRVVLFGSGSPMSVRALEALAGSVRVLAAVVPAAKPGRGLRPGARRLYRWRAGLPLARLARALRVPILRHRPDRSASLAEALARLEPDLICVATFPSLLKPSLLEAPRLGALGVHPSLLPRHRGPDPLFWTYFHADADAGVTVFWLDEGEDTGDLVVQESIPVARGRPGLDLYDEVARRGSALLVRAIEEVRNGTAPRIRQDPARATREPAPRPGTWRIDFTTWGAERVWHFLRGVATAGGVLTDSRGHPLPHGAARRFVLGSVQGTPGSVERSREGWRLFCLDGFVEVDPPSLAGRASRTARRLIARL